MYRISAREEPPPPRTIVPTWLLVGFAVAAALALTATIAVTILAIRVRTSLRTPAPTASPTSVAPGARPPMIATRTPLRPPATPAWAADQAPQLEAPSEAFQVATPVSAPVSDVFLICRVQTFNHADALSGDDVSVRATFGATPSVSADGIDGANLAFVSAPRASLAMGELVSFEVDDRDVFSTEVIARTSSAYRGGSLDPKGPGADVECRELSGASLDRLVATREKPAAEAIIDVSDARLDGKQRDWGWPTTRIDHAQRRVSDIAALVAWHDPRARVCNRDLAGAMSSLEAQRARVFGELQTGSGSTLTLKGLRAGVTGVRESALDVRVTNEGTEPVMLSQALGFGGYVATAKQGPVAVTFGSSGDEAIAAGSVVAIEVRVTAPFAGLDTEPAIFALCDANDCATARVR